MKAAWPENWYIHIQLSWRVYFCKTYYGEIMALAYTKEFLIDAYIYRFYSLKPEVIETLKNLAKDAYDKYGKDEFRKLASLDADAIKQYKLWMKNETDRAK